MGIDSYDRANDDAAWSHVCSYQALEKIRLKEEDKGPGEVLECRTPGASGLCSLWCPRQSCRTKNPNHDRFRCDSASNLER